MKNLSLLVVFVLLLNVNQLSATSLDPATYKTQRKITSITEASYRGRLKVTVNYIAHCGDVNPEVETKHISPAHIGIQTVEVKVLAGTNRDAIRCIAATYPATISFDFNHSRVPVKFVAANLTNPGDSTSFGNFKCIGETESGELLTLQSQSNKIITFGHSRLTVIKSKKEGNSLQLQAKSVNLSRQARNSSEYQIFIGLSENSKALVISEFMNWVGQPVVKSFGLDCTIQL